MTDPRDGRDVETLEALYASLPEMRCRQQCWDSCTTFPTNALEHRHIKEKTGISLLGQSARKHKSLPRCPALSEDNRCMIYAVRPMICRIFGMTKLLSCGHGCVPEGGYLPTEEAFVLINRVLRLSGDRQAVSSDEAVRQYYRSGEIHLALSVGVILMDAGIDPRDFIEGLSR